MYATVLGASFMHCWECFLFLAIHRKRAYQTLSPVGSSIIVLWFGSLVLLGFKEKSANYIKSSYHEMLTKQGLVNIRIKNSQQLMIEIFQFIKGLSPVIMNEMFMLRNIQYIISNATDLDNQFPKTVYCGLKTIPYKGPQLWQQLLRK